MTDRQARAKSALRTYLPHCDGRHAALPRGRHLAARSSNSVGPTRVSDCLHALDAPALRPLLMLCPAAVGCQDQSAPRPNVTTDRPNLQAQRR